MKLDPKMLLFGLVAAMTLSGKKQKGPSGGALRMPKDGARFSLDELRQLAEQAGFPDPSLAAAVAMAESGGYAGAVGDQGTSFGLWQIHVPAHPEYKGKETLLADPTFNAGAAMAISQRGTNWSPWTTYKTGAYQRWMPSPPVAGAAQLAPAPAAAPEPEPAAEPAPLEREPERATEPEPEKDDGTPPAEVEDLDQVEDLDATRLRVAEGTIRTGRGRRARRG